ncbi:MAG: hypothetical protein ACLT2T_13990 [Bilophila wadsworthia]
MMAHSGQITGSPPKDNKLRQALEATGWQPYSIKVGDKYLSYRRLDPAGMFLGIAADLAVAGQYLNKDQYDDAVSMAVAALSNNVTSKTYMQGISELIDFINDPIEKVIQYFGRMGLPSSPRVGGPIRAPAGRRSHARDARLYGLHHEHHPWLVLHPPRPEELGHWRYHQLQPHPLECQRPRAR